MTGQSKDFYLGARVQGNDEREKIKKTYVKPQLITHGSVEQLTQGAPVGAQEGETGTSISGDIPST